VQFHSHSRLGVRRLCKHTPALSNFVRHCPIPQSTQTSGDDH